jgi:TPR repeat protein
VDSGDDDFKVQQGVSLLQQAAEMNNAEALFILGKLAMAGHGLPPSEDEAFKYCRKAAELGHRDAQYEVAAMYALGRGTKPDDGKAIEWGRKAIAQGNPKAKYSVGRLLLIRQDAADQREALDLLAQASDAGIDEAGMFLAEAQVDGKYGVVQDRDAGMAVLEKVAARGNKRAKEVLAQLRAEGS